MVQIPSGGGAFLVERLALLPALDTVVAPETAAVVRLARGFMAKEVAPKVAAMEAQEPGVMVEALKRAGALGLLSLDIPEEDGGPGLGRMAALLVQEALGGVGSFAVTAGAHTTIGTLPLTYFGNATQKARLLPQLMDARLVAAYALTEPGGETDALSVATSATRDGDGFILRGTKQWITNAGFADLFTVFAKVDGQALTAFLVERGDPGVSTGAEENKLGIRGSSTRRLVLEEARIPAGRVLGQEGRGHRVAMGIIHAGRMKLGAGALGGARAALALAVDHARTRKQFGVTIGSFGMVRQLVAGMAVRLLAVEACVDRVGLAVDGNVGAQANAKSAQQAVEELAAEASILKILGSEMLCGVADDALQVHGGMGFSEELPLARMWRDARVNRIFEGTNETNRLNVASTLLKRVQRGLLDGVPSTPGPGVEGVRALCQAAAKAVLAHTGGELDGHQHLLALLADLACWLFSMDCLTARRVSAGGVHAVASQLWLEQGVDQALLLARRLAGALPSDPGLEVCVRALEQRDVSHWAELVDALAQEVMAQGGLQRGF